MRGQFLIPLARGLDLGEVEGIRARLWHPSGLSGQPFITVTSVQRTQKPLPCCCALTKWRPGSSLLRKGFHTQWAT